MSKTHYLLSVWADDPLTEIWVGDTDHHFVCKATGWLNERLEPGTYVVQVGGLKAPKHHIKLVEDTTIDEKYLRGKTMTRRRLIRKSGGLLARTFIVVALGIVLFLATQHVRAAETCKGAVQPVKCVTENIRVGDELTTVLEVLGLPLSTFEGVACPPGAEPGDERCTTSRVSIHIIGEMEFVVAYGAGVVQSVDVRPVPPAHKPLLESIENPFR